MIPSPGTEHQEVAGRLAFALESSLRKVRKLWTYEAAGVPEYLIVDPDEQVGLLLRLENHRYEMDRESKGPILTRAECRWPAERKELAPSFLISRTPGAN